MLVLLAAPAWGAQPPPRSPDAAKVLDERIADARRAVEASPDDAAARVALAKLLHYKAGRGDDKARREAYKLWEQLQKANPDDPVAAAYRGSSVLQSAPHAWAPWKKGELAKQGVVMLNEAVEAAPDDLEVRLIRGLSTAKLPADFGLAEQSQADVAAVAAMAPEAADEHGTLSPDLAAAALYAHGVNRLIADDPAAAAELWRTAVTRWPDSPAARDADHALHLTGDGE